MATGRLARRLPPNEPAARCRVLHQRPDRLRRAAPRGRIGWAPGRDIAFVGFDDGPLNDWVAPWLNAVRVPYGEYGAAIVRALQGEPGEIVLPHRLVVRQTAASRLG